MKLVWLSPHGDVGDEPEPPVRSSRLLIFCNGWGMDETPFRPLAAGSAVDILMLYDYHDLELHCVVARLFSRYSSVSLVAWSLGVWVGQQLFRHWAHRFHTAIAIAGTLCPIHDQLGIPAEMVRGTIAQWSEASRLKFYRRVCQEPLVLETFLQHQPQRTVESQRLELAALQRRVDCEGMETAIYHQVLITEQDRIFPAAHQLAFWQQGRLGLRVRRVQGPHFPFYAWQNWDDLLELAGEEGR